MQLVFPQVNDNFKIVGLTDVAIDLSQVSMKSRLMLGKTTVTLEFGHAYKF